jgi:hypothetical protein
MGTPLELPVPGVLVNDGDPDGDPIVAVLLRDPRNGDVELNANGSFVYRPDPGFAGIDRFVYRARDAELPGNPPS